MTSFTLVYSVKVNETIPVFKYKSSATGLTLILANVEGPVVNGYFCLATEAEDDDGLPHTLEHLIFLGSELYPYKGVLDMLANRCLASGTNAWTDVDHTCYTMTTAGKDGFLELMPIYLDHILYPTLSDAGYTTEVHHVSESGEDGGVVYSEMQGRENTGESLAHLQLVRAAYPNCGYSAETGGILHNIRTSTTNEKVRKYHKEFYRPENLAIIIAGQVTVEEVLKALKPFEERILSKQINVPFTKPWQKSVAPLEKSENIKILYPADEEDTGIVSIGWRGPKCTAEHLKLTACSILLRYLTSTSVSPLHREFVEIADPYASDVSSNIFENSETFIYFHFENVPLDKIDLIFDKLQIILLKIADGDEKIDMVRLSNILDISILEHLSNLETSPHEAISFLAIADFLYGNTVDDFEMRLNVIKQFEYLQTRDHSYWIDLMKEFMIRGKNIVVRAVPSIEEQNRLARAESDRVDKQRKEFGEKGLQAKGEALAEAMKINSIAPPENMLTNVPIPTVDGIHFHPVKIFRNGDTTMVEKVAGINLDTIPVYAEAYDVHTNFVYLILTMNTDTVPANLAPYLILFLELITVSPIRQLDDTGAYKLVTYEEVVAELEKDTIQFGTHLGLESGSDFHCGPFSHTSSLMMQVERKKYNRGIRWIVDLLQNTEFTIDRIRVCAAKIVNSIPQAKRKGSSIAYDLLKTMYYAEDSNVRVSSILYQQKFLNSILERLNNDETALTVISDLNSLRNQVTLAENMAVHVAANWKEMTRLNIDLNSEWLKLLKSNDKPCKQQYQIIPDWAKMSPLQNIRQGTIVGLGCVDSAFLYHAAPSINSFLDSTLADLLVFLQYLTQLEGPLWRQIRGQGLAYGYNIMPQPQEGLIYLTLYKCSNVAAAFKEAKAIIEAQLQPNAVWESTLLESAKGSLIFEIIKRERSIGNLVIQSLLSNFKKVPVNYNKMLIQRVNAVTVDDLVTVGQRYLSLLFAPEAKTAIVCHPDKMNEVATEFLQMNRDLVVQSCLDDSILGSKCVF